MSIKLKGSTDGSVTLQAPADTSPTGTDKTFTLPTQDGDAGQILKTDGSGALSFTDNLSSGRNLIINGAMEVAQRGTSSTDNGYVSLDRWFVNQSGGSTTFSQETFAAGSEIDSLKNYAKLDVTTSSDFTTIQQRIEDVRTVPAGTITVSFWAKGTAPSGNLAVYCNQNFGTSGSTGVTIAQQTVTLTSSWQRFDLQFTVPSLSGKTINAGSYFEVAIGQGTNTGTTAYELNITGVQLEVGSTATSFEHRSFGDELAKCQRYFQKSYSYEDAPGTVTSGNKGNDFVYLEGGNTSPHINLKFYPEMRITPNITTYSVANANTTGKLTASSTDYSTGTNSAVNSAKNFLVFATGVTAADDIYVAWTANAEL